METDLDQTLRTITEDKINSLSDLFPHIPRTKVWYKLNSENISHNSLEELVEAIITDEELSKDDIPLECFKIYEIVAFPIERIRTEYEREGQDMEKTITKLTEAKDRINDKRSPKDLVRLLGIKEPTIRLYWSKHGYDYLKTLIAVISYEIKISTTGYTPRVQRAGKLEYTYDENQPESIELEGIYNDNENFQRIYKPFRVKLLAGLKGDINRVTEISFEIIERHLHHQTFEKKEPELEKRLSGIKASTIKANLDSKLAGSLYSTVAEKSIKPSQKLNDFNNQFQNGIHLNKPNSHKSPSYNQSDLKFNNLDLHGLQPQQAINLVGRTVTNWWAQEIRAREYDGKLHSYGSTVSFVDNLKIITGQGIHSRNGVSVIKIQIRKYLLNKNYIIEENSWGFYVTGKKLRS